MRAEAPNSTNIPDLYREFSRQATRVHNWLLPPIGVAVLMSGALVVNKWVGLVEDEFLHLYAPAIANIGIVAEGATFAGILPRLRESHKRAGEIALEIARAEGREGQDAKSEILRVGDILRYKWAINRTAALDLASEIPVPIHPLERFRQFNLRLIWACNRDYAENPFYPAQHRGVLFESAVELSLLEWQLIENDPQKSTQERTHAADMFLTIRRLRGTLLNP